jgi:hypothetical protein
LAPGFLSYGKSQVLALTFQAKNENLRRCGPSRIHPLHMISLGQRFCHPHPAKVWNWYLQLQQAETAFLCTKSDLSLHPIFHQKTERVEAHILSAFSRWHSGGYWNNG